MSELWIAIPPMQQHQSTMDTNENILYHLAGGTPSHLKAPQAMLHTRWGNSHGCCRCCASSLGLQWPKEQIGTYFPTCSILFSCFIHHVYSCSIHLGFVQKQVIPCHAGIPQTAILTRTLKKQLKGKTCFCSTLFISIYYFQIHPISGLMDHQKFPPPISPAGAHSCPWQLLESPGQDLGQRT